MPLYILRYCNRMGKSFPAQCSQPHSITLLHSDIVIYFDDPGFNKALELLEKLLLF